MVVELYRVLNYLETIYISAGTRITFIGSSFIWSEYGRFYYHSTINDFTRYHVYMRKQ